MFHVVNGIVLVKDEILMPFKDMLVPMYHFLPIFQPVEKMYTYIHGVLNIVLNYMLYDVDKTALMCQLHY